MSDDTDLLGFYNEMVEHCRQNPPTVVIKMEDIQPLVNCYGAALDGDMEEAERWAEHPVCQEWLKRQQAES